MNVVTLPKNLGLGPVLKLVTSHIARPASSLVRARRLLLLSWVAAITAGCHVSREWDEEVKLSDGQTIVVTRKSIRERVGEPGAGSGQPVDDVLVVSKPISATWHGDTNPISLDIDKGNVYVVGWIRGWPGCEKYGFPSLPFAYFRYRRERGVWEQIKPDDAPPGMRPNLLISGWTYEMERNKGVLLLNRKIELNSSILRRRPGLADFHSGRSHIKDPGLLRCAKSIATK